MKEKYQEMIKDVSIRLAEAVLNNEPDLAKRALLSDGDISEITRQIGAESTKMILEKTVEQCSDEKKKKCL
jgi:hypothetical protein